MQHPCSRCGATVEDSSPFCAACDAPQVRFEPQEQDREQLRLHPEIVPPSPARAIAAPTTLTYGSAAASNLPRFLRAAAYAASIGFLLCFLPFGPLLGLPVAGWLAVRFHSRAARVSLQPLMGFRIGALAGLLVFVMQSVLGTIAAIELYREGELRKTLLEIANRSHSFNPNLQPQEFVDLLMTPAGAIALLIIFAVTCIVLAGASGWVSALISRRRPSR